jgi:hypothetical protein
VSGMGADPAGPARQPTDLRVPLADLLDRLLGTGAVVVGDLTLAVADVDLVHVSLRALLASVTAGGAPGRAPESPAPADDVPVMPTAPAWRGRQRLTTDRDTVERDLVRLVLSIVELLRQLMELQALRRVDRGDLSEDQEERVGMTLLELEDRMAWLRERYGLTEEDLRLDLGG